MNIRELEYYKMVCQQKSITKAAHALYMMPQGLSKIIKNIENELEATLLNRTSSGITLTKSGEYLYEHLEDFLVPYHHICSEIRCIEQRFLQGEGNVAFTVGDSSTGYMDATFMEKFEIKLLVNREYALAKKESVSIADLKGERLYLESPEFSIHHLIVDKCREAGFEPNLVFETSGFSLCHKMVQQNKGISVTVDFIFEDMKQDSLVMLPFSDGEYFWSTYMLTRKGSVPNPDILLFHNHVMRWLKMIAEKKLIR